MQIKRNNRLKAKLVYIILCFLGLSSGIDAQIQPPVDSIGSQLDSIVPTLPVGDTVFIGVDSLQILSDSLGDNTSKIQLSKDSLDAPVQYTATDSMIYDIADKKIHLYGEGVVNYTTISVKADHIIFDWETNIVTAEGMPDSLGRLSGFPEFKDGDQEFKAERMRYNFKTRKGIVYDVTTQQGDMIVQGTKSKFVSGDPGDTTSNDIVYSNDAIFTTCTHPEPHFGIRSGKQKVIPNKLVVVGPSNLEIMGVPTPLWLPFGFFPISKTRSTGLLFPRDYEYSDQWGFGLRDIGWFFPLGEHFNLSLKANIYVKGTWGLTAESQYRKRYKYNGRFSIGYDVRRSEALDGMINREKSFKLQLSHNQDPSAHPLNSFGGTINFQLNGYQARVYNDAQSVLNNQLSSNFSFSRNWRDKPISMSLSFNHSQNTNTNNITVNFPNFQFQTQTLYPFRRKERVGKEKWYENITMRYTGEAKSTFTGPDSTFFSQRTLDEARYGARHKANAGTSIKLLKYFNVNPNVNYEEVWYFKTIRRDFIDDPKIEIDTVNGIVTRDTLTLGQINNQLIQGFQSFRTFSAGVSMNTQIFGTMLFKKGWLRGVRHVIKPSVSLGYTPSYLSEDLGWYRTVQDTLDPTQFDRYSIFDGGIYGSPSSSGKQMALSYSINNIFEAKYFSKKDSSEKNLKLFDNIVISGNYNFAADSLKWSRINISGTTRFFKGMTTLSFRTVFDPYVNVFNKNSSRRTSKLRWKEEGKLLQFIETNVRLNTSVTVSKIRALFQGKEEEIIENLDEEEENQRTRKRPEETDFLSLFEQFRIAHTFVLDFEKTTGGRDTFKLSTHSLSLSGSVQLTPNWNINMGNIGYDFVSKAITYPYLGFSRDLHCWQMGLSWAPTRGTYSFYIQVKPGTLGFLRVPYDRNNADAIRAFQ
ncbi:MAG: hypothetical protein DHS20C18_19500 [Saprospiraceae bacterium]|nr:MAG: hypothetical protein DHS20C18_19500 [Saprospiraceae bacterium]